MIHDMIMAAAGASGPAAPSDADFENTVLLLHGDGTNGAQNNTFLDSSTNNFTITRNGNTTQGSFSPFSKPDGRWGNYFDGSGDSLSVASNAAFAFGTGDFTIEFWLYPTSTTQRNVTFPTSNAPIVYMNTSRQLVVGNYGIGDLATSSNTLTLNAWNHCAVARSGSTLKVFVNGVEGASVSNSTNFVQSSVNIGVDVSSNFCNGYMSNVRIVKGSAAYTSGFTPSTSPLTAISGTSLLTCQSNRFIDNSTNNFTITRNGDVRVTPFSPFPITTAYDPAVNGGSGYFDGSGDYLATPSNSALSVGTGAFTLECFVYLNDVSAGVKGIVGQLTNTSATYGLNFYTNGTTLNATVQNTSGSVVGFTTTVSSGQWYHLAFVKNGSNSISAFVNGARIGNTTSTQTIDLTSFVIGRTYTNVDGNYGNNFISNVRLVKGTAVYDPTQTTITVPTAPLTAVANTSLLCNFTNAGIFDNTGFNNLETVGNAQIDTTTKKYGTGSMEFDGSGDWLTIANTPDLQLGTGNFTVEFWVYLATGDTGSNRGLVGKGGASTGWLVSLNTTQKVVFTYASSTITSSGAITTNAWNHIAVVREGTGSNQTKIYIGGTNDGTGTVSTDFNQTEIMYVGANRTGGDPMKGFIDDLRITKGKARYTTTFTPPTAALPDIGE